MTVGDALTVTVGLLLCGALLAVVLRVQRPELAMCLSLAAGVAVLVVLVGQFTPLIASMRRMLSSASVPSAYFGVVLKAMGVCLLTQLTADTCRDAGETALAAKAELVGRVLMLVLAVPLFEGLLSLVVGLLDGQVLLE